MKSIAAAVVLFAVSFAASTAQERGLDRGSFVSAVTGDWNKDGASDLVLLTQGEEEDVFDLHFYLQDAAHAFLKEIEVVPGKVWGHAGPDFELGWEPRLAALPDGSITVTTHSEAMGREYWVRTLTLAYHNGNFIVTNSAFEDHDGFDPTFGGKCDLDALTGKGVATRPDGKGGNEKVEYNLGAKAIRFSDWNYHYDLKACGLSLEQKN